LPIHMQSARTLRECQRTTLNGRSGQGGSEGSFQGATDIQDLLPNNNLLADASFLEIVNHASVDWMSLSMSIDCQMLPIFVLVVTGKPT
jgi:hypothetical protein